MEKVLKITKAENFFISIMGRLPVLSYYARSRGWPFLITWGHRLAGITLVGYMLAHIYTLSLLFSPATFDADMKLLDHFIFSFLEWAVAIPLIFHSLNGGRLTLYEIFHVREEKTMLRSMSFIGLIYVLIVGFFFIKEGRQISAGLFWAIIASISFIAFFIVAFKVWTTGNSFLWKAQRATGAFMLPMLIGHMLFMHMNYLMGHDSGAILSRMHDPLIKTIDFLFIAFLVPHAAYGIFSIIADYIKPGWLLKSITLIIVIVMAVLTFFGIRLIVFL